MRAITVKQPWAWAIALGGKDVENRGRPGPWRSAVGERIAIHAGKQWDAAAIEDRAIVDLAYAAARAVRRDFPEQWGSLLAAPATYLLPTFHRQGEVLATAVLVDLHHADTCARSWGGPRCSVWGQPDAWHLVLDEVERVVPMPARGALGLWTLPDLPIPLASGGGVNAVSGPAKDAHQGRPLSPSGVPAPPPAHAGLA